MENNEPSWQRRKNSFIHARYFAFDEAIDNAFLTICHFYTHYAAAEDLVIAHQTQGHSSRSTYLPWSYTSGGVVT